MKNFFDVLFKYGDNKDFDKQHLVVCEKLHMLYNHINALSRSCFPKGGKSLGSVKPGMSLLLLITPIATMCILTSFENKLNTNTLH
jgi:hypothetical protein